MAVQQWDVEKLSTEIREIMTTLLLLEMCALRLDMFKMLGHLLP